MTSLEHDDAELPTKNLPDLTPNQRAFVKAILDGKNASDAYRLAYDTEAADTTIWANASRLRNSNKVRAWISAARQAHLGTAIVTQDTHLRELERIKEASLDAAEFKTALTAEIARGRVAGLYIERLDITINNPAALLAEIAQIDPDTAKALAARFAIPLAGPVINAKAIQIDQHDEQEDDEEDDESNE